MPSEKRARKNLGDSAERIAALALEEQGYRILARNVRTRAGEIDLVAEDGEGIVFVEVKARRGKAAGLPEEAITPRKQLQLVRLAEALLAEHSAYVNRDWRIDAVLVELDRGGKLTRLEILKNAVQL